MRKLRLREVTANASKLCYTHTHTEAHKNQRSAFKVYARASLVVQWLRNHLPMQGTRVQALVRVDPTCRGATKPVQHNY